MTGSPIERLAHANPVPEPPDVLPFEAMSRLIEDERPSAVERNGRADRRVHGSGRRALAAIACLAGAAIATALLAIGSSNPSVNVLAAVYAATAPRAGIVESVTVTREYARSGRHTTTRLREWREAAGQRHRGLATFTVSGSRASQVADVVYSPRVWEGWSAGPVLASSLPWIQHHGSGVVSRLLWTGPHAPNDRAMGYGTGGGLVGEEWARTFRALYRTHQFMVSGRVSHAGRLLWKLEAVPAVAARRAREDHTQYYVLVDPHTFLPVYTRLIDLARPGHPTMSESELIGYRTLIPSKANKQLFDLRAQHPKARVATQTLRST